MSLGPSIQMDKVDPEILDLLSIGKNNKEISASCKIPLSTVQRRVRNLLNGGLITANPQINYEKLGFKTGHLHVYLRIGDIEKTANKIYELDGITSVEIHIGNSDIIGYVIYKDGVDLLNLISQIKKMEGVDRVAWSKRIYQSPYKKDMINFALNKFKNN